MRLAAQALAEGEVRCECPLSEEGLLHAYLPESEFKGRENHKIRYALLAGAASYADVEVDLLDEVVHWVSDDFWSYAALAAVVWIRAVADQRGIPLAELVDRLRLKAGMA